MDKIWASDPSPAPLCGRRCGFGYELADETSPQPSQCTPPPSGAPPLPGIRGSITKKETRPKRSTPALLLLGIEACVLPLGTYTARARSPTATETRDQNNPATSSLKKGVESLARLWFYNGVQGCRQIEPATYSVVCTRVPSNRTRTQRLQPALQQMPQQPTGTNPSTLPEHTQQS